MAEVADSSFAARLAEQIRGIRGTMHRIDYFGEVFSEPVDGYVLLTTKEAKAILALVEAATEAAALKVSREGSLLRPAEDDIDKWVPVFPKIVAALEALND